MKNIAVLGLGGISSRIIQGVLEAENAVLYAVAARDLKRAKSIQKQFGASVAYGSYDDLVMDPNVDLVYIATANQFHCEQIELCIRHGKHVLCEKPMVATREQLKTLFALAKQQGVFLMEAEKTLFTPLNQKLKAFVKAGGIGDIVSMEGAYCNSMYLDEKPEQHWVFDKAFGGALFDIGVYPICYLNYFADSPTQEVTVHRIYGVEQCDIYARGMIRYQNGVIGTFCTGWIGPNENNGMIYGTKGYIKTHNFWKHNVAEVVYANGESERIEVAKSSDFKGQIEHAIQCLEQGLLESPILGEKESLEILNVILQR